MSKLTVINLDDNIQFKKGFSNNKVAFKFNRTLVVPAETKETPCGHGTLKVYQGRMFPNAPEEWRTKNHAFIPMHQHEALFLSFESKKDFAKAVKILVDGKNVVTGLEDTTGKLHENDYIVPHQESHIDTADKTSEHKVQLKAPKLGSDIDCTRIEIQVFETAKEPDDQLRQAPSPVRMCSMPNPNYLNNSTRPFKIKAPTKKFLPTRGIDMCTQYELKHWNTEECTSQIIHLTNSQMFVKITGREMPSSPITEETYANYEYPFVN
jgi:hypothetical protein